MYKVTFDYAFYGMPRGFFVTLKLNDFKIRFNPISENITITYSYFQYLKKKRL